MLLELALGLPALAGSATLWRAARREAQAEAGYPPEGRMVDIGPTRVHAVDMGSGPDVVLIHGSAGSTRDMTFALAPVLARFCRVIVFDRPGHGYTPAVDPTGDSISDQADLLQRAAQRMGAVRPVVLGHSYGGAVALAWAVRHPEAIGALVPVAAASHPWTTPLEPFYRATSSRLGATLAVPLLTAFVPQGYVARAVAEVFAPQPAPPGYARHFGPGLTLRRASLRANARQRANLLAEISALSRRYGEIAVPTEIVHGTADATVDPDLHAGKLAQQIEGSVLTRLAGIGHMPQHLATDAVAAAVRRAATRAGLR